MAVHDKRLAKSHDDVLEAMADALDIPPSQFEEAKSRYEAIGNWLDRPEFDDRRIRSGDLSARILLARHRDTAVHRCRRI